MGLVDRKVLDFVNHLLDDASWARARLSPFAGQVVQLNAGSFSHCAVITSAGMLDLAGSAQAPDVLLALPGDFVARALLNRNTLMSAVKVQGHVELAEAIGFVFKNLRWDPEADLSHWTGDIAARRLAQLGRRSVAYAADAGLRLQHNVKEFLIDESGMLCDAVSVAGFSDEVTKLRDQLARLEKRISQLEA